MVSSRIHGGSFVVGSASGPGLDGSTLAAATGSIVAVIQYRLGAFGFLSPSNETNLAVKDVVTALHFLQEVLPAFGGDGSKVTIAGQSSGASMVRALLATPSAAGLFQSAILQSDPMVIPQIVFMLMSEGIDSIICLQDYGFLTTSAFTNLNDYFISQLSCSASDTTCLANLSTDSVLSTSMTVFDNAASIDPSLGSFEPMRCVTDGSLITSPLDATAFFPPQSKPIIVSTVADESGKIIYGTYTSPVSESEWEQAVQQSLGSSRAATVTNSSFYAIPSQDASNASSFDARTQLEALGTDQIWRCPSWTFARLFAAAGGTVYVGEYAVGVTYPDNEAVPYCTEGDTVCHEDDIEIVFGTASDPSANQTSLIQAMQGRYKAFFATGNPGGGWTPVSGQETNAIILGGSSDGSQADVGACDPSFWGSAVQYDYQVFDA